MVKSVHVITTTEQRLLLLLLHNSRAGAVALARDLSKSRNWVTRTLRQLTKDNVVRAYTTVLDPLQAYSERSTILLIKTNPRELGVSRALLEMPGLESLDGVSGEYSLLGLFRFRSADAFETFLNMVDSTIAQSGSKTYELVQVLTTYKTKGFIVHTHKASEVHLTPKDWALLDIIRRHVPSESNPFPMSQLEIGRRMAPPLSQPAVSKAMTRLEESGIILGYSIDLLFIHIGLPIKFFLEIKPAPGSIAETAHVVAEMNEVWDLHRTSESFSLFATVRCSSILHYNQFLRRLYENSNIIDTRSQISLEEWFIPV
ncbi:MAG: Lrp/AsnC family transcriptional regulator [Candidatus Thorarchaeota archaeon]|nr:Lrp/AsnC family transcriptional regulator [Candidatus Thorarchaeota archaeon]